MTWVAHTERVRSRAQRLVTVQMKRGKRDSRARFMVYFCKAAMDRLQWKAGDPVGLLLGEGEHADRLRVVRTRGREDDPPVVASLSRALKGSARVDFGVVAALGDEARETTDAVTEFVDDNVVEITLPSEDEWGRKRTAPLGRAGPDRTEEPRRPEPQQPARQAQAIESANFYRSPRGVVISTGRDSESITFRGMDLELTLKQALMLEAMERTFPEPCDRVFILKKVFGIKPPPTADNVLRASMSSIAVGLARMKLRVRPVGGRPTLPDGYVLESIA